MAEARRLVRDLLPRDKSVFTAASETLRISGLRADIDDSGEFRSVRAELAGVDPADIRTQIKMGAAPDVVVGSVHAVTEDGILVAASASGSQLAPYAAGAERVIWLIGAQKVVPDLETALRRVRTYSLPREHDRVRATGFESFIGKLLILEREFLPDRGTVVLVRETIGFWAKPRGAGWRQGGVDTATDVQPVTGFDAVFDAQFEAMKRLAFLLGADDPENIAQEAFVRLHGRWDSLAAGKALPYLRRTVVNLSRSRLRHLRVVRRAPRERNADIASAETTVLASHDHVALRDALVSLPARQRQVLVLRYWLDLGQAEIAETLGIAVGTVKATTNHAMASLRKALAAEEDHS